MTIAHRGDPLNEQSSPKLRTVVREPGRISVGILGRQIKVRVIFSFCSTAFQQLNPQPQGFPRAQPCGLWVLAGAAIVLCHQGTALFRSSTVWSCFSGLNAGIRGLHQIMMSFVRYAVRLHFVCTATCDIEARIVQSLCDNYSEGCVFRDVCDYFDYHHCRQYGDLPYDSKKYHMATAPLRTARFCERHKCQCRICPGEIAIGGFPCVDFSAAGFRAGTEGASALCILVAGEGFACFLRGAVHHRFFCIWFTFRLGCVLRHNRI